MYPSIEQPWLKWYEEGAFEKAIDFPQGVTLWDVLEKELIKHQEIDAFEYFQRMISRPDFIDSVYLWARVFRAMGVEENEIVPIYSPLFPDIGAMALGLNVIGATSYFLKLSMSEKDFLKETEGMKRAVVFDAMWPNVEKIFSDDRFKSVIVASAADSMLWPKSSIVSMLNYLKFKKDNINIPNSKKYIKLPKAKSIADYHTGNVRVEFVPNRSAFITSSSGTTINGQVKGAIATNESAIAQLYQSFNSDVPYHYGKTCLNNLPPTASTSLHALYFYPLYKGMKIIIDPRLSEKGVFNQIMTYRPQVLIMTGSFWEEFFRIAEAQLRRGVKLDFSFFDMPVIGGEGVTPEVLAWMNRILLENGAKTLMISGYGLSEVFSVCTAEKSNLPTFQDRRPVISVGIPFPGVTAGVFNRNNEELSYNQRGELWVKAKSMMKGYHGKEELTKESMNGEWLKTGDECEIDKDGRIYYWGRMSDEIEVNENEKYFLFDIANLLRQHKDVQHSLVNPMPMTDGSISLVAHIVINDPLNADRKKIYKELDELMFLNYSDKIKITGYKEHKEKFPSSPTTAKKDRNKLIKELIGYQKTVDDEIKEIYFEEDEQTKRLKVFEKEENKSLKKAKQKVLR
jgi:acyl-coenzyme A synthetase/AMP-(fatty) acid ligase